jgi:ATP-dependent helicase HrpA
VQRAGVDLEKDRAKAAAVGPYSGQLDRLLKSLSPESSSAKRQAIEDLFWMIEEYKVSLFAQELKTAQPVSPKRLAQKIAEIERMI